MAWPSSSMSSWRERQPLAGGDADAGLDDVDAGHHLGDAVLDLHARVHLHEVEAAVAVEQELDGAGALVVRGDGGGHGGLAHLRRAAPGSRPATAPPR